VIELRILHVQTILLKIYLKSHDVPLVFPSQLSRSWLLTSTPNMTGWSSVVGGFLEQSGCCGR
jgi:hypothetical protein